MSEFAAIYYSHDDMMHDAPHGKVLRHCWPELTRSVYAAGGIVIAVTDHALPRRHPDFRASPAIIPIIKECMDRGHRDLYTRILCARYALAMNPQIRYAFTCEHDVIYNARYFERMVEYVKSLPKELATAVHYNTNAVYWTRRGYVPHNPAYRLLSNMCGTSNAVMDAIVDKQREFIHKCGQVVWAEPGTKEGIDFTMTHLDCPPVIDVRDGCNLTGDRGDGLATFEHAHDEIPNWSDLAERLFREDV